MTVQKESGLVYAALFSGHDVFAVDDYVPDIVIFALGTNDGTPNDTYDSAMSKTVLKSDNTSIDVFVVNHTF